MGKKHTLFLKVKWFVPNIASTYRRKQRTPIVQISAGYEVISLVTTSGAVKETRYKYIFRFANGNKKTTQQYLEQEVRF